VVAVEARKTPGVAGAVVPKMPGESAARVVAVVADAVAAAPVEAVVPVLATAVTARSPAEHAAG
jgi:hypothetical protein